MYKLSDLSVGMVLPELKKVIKQENINLYAEVSGDKNPIHLDPEFGKKMRLGGTIAHGMMVLAYVSEYMAVNFGNDWLTGGKLSVRFKEPARPGETINISGKIAGIEKRTGEPQISCEVTCENPKGLIILTGDTEARLKK